MNENQCSFCGMTAFFDGDICFACQTALGQIEAAPQTAISENQFETSEFASSNESLQQTFESPNYASAAPQTELITEAQQMPRRTSASDWKRCPICNAGIAQYRDVCSRCATVNQPVKQKSSYGKFVFILLFVGLIGGGIYYVLNGSTLAIVRKFEKATGSSGSLAAETFVMKGSSKVAVQQVISAQEVAFSGRSPMRKEESYLFDFSYKSPNKSLMDFYKMNGSSRESAMTQGFNGTAGWKYAKIFDQPAKLENTGNGFSEGNIGLGVGDYKSLSDLDDLSKTEFAGAIGYYRDLVKTFEVEGNTKNSNNKAYLISKKTKADGTAEKTLLVFDEESGFMIGMAKTDLMDNKPVTTIGLFNNYKKFWLKEKGLFGIKNKFVSIPTVWTFKIGELEALAGTGAFTVNLSLEIEGITMDVPIDDAIFEKPAK